MWKDVVGWVSSGVLVVTVASQVLKQWREGSSKGVSRWLFIGQLVASGGFVLYSYLVHSMVFVLTNALMLANALIGYAVVMVHRRRQARRGPTEDASAKSDALVKSARALVRRAGSHHSPLYGDLVSCICDLATALDDGRSRNTRKP